MQQRLNNVSFAAIHFLNEQGAISKKGETWLQGWIKHAGTDALTLEDVEQATIHKFKSQQRNDRYSNLNTQTNRQDCHRPKLHNS